MKMVRLLLIIASVFLTACVSRASQKTITKKKTRLACLERLDAAEANKRILEAYIKKRGYKVPSYQEFRDKCLFLLGVSLNKTPEDYAYNISSQMEYTINEPARLIYTEAENLFYQPQINGEPTEEEAIKMLENKENGIGDKLIAYNKLLFNDDDATLAYFMNHQEDAIEVVYNLDYEKKTILTKKAITFACQTDVYTEDMEDILFYKNKERGFRKNFITDIYQQCCTDNTKMEPFEDLVDAYHKDFVKLNYAQPVKDECLLWLIDCLIDFDEKHPEYFTKLTDTKSYQHLSNFIGVDKQLVQRLTTRDFYKNSKLRKLVSDIKLITRSTEGFTDYYISDSDGYCNIRKSKGLSAQIIKRITSGCFVNVLEKQGNWWKVQTKDGVIGYMHKSRIRRALK